MKKLVFILGLGFCTVGFCQQKTDKIVVIKKDGVSQKIRLDTLYVNITNIGDTKISYAYPEESFTQNIAILTVKEIRFASGRIQKFTEPVVVTGEKDWEKVIISNNPEYVAGFEEYGPVKEMDMKPYGVQSVLEKNAIKKAKIIAARKGAHVVFVYSNQFSHSPWNNVTISGTAYGYSSE